MYWVVFFGTAILVALLIHFSEINPLLGFAIALTGLIAGTAISNHESSNT